MIEKDIQQLAEKYTKQIQRGVRDGTPLVDVFLAAITEAFSLTRQATLEECAQLAEEVCKSLKWKQGAGIVCQKLRSLASPSAQKEKA